MRDRYRVPLPCLETESENTQVLKIVLSVLVPGFRLLNQCFFHLTSEAKTRDALDGFETVAATRLEGGKMIPKPRGKYDVRL